ESADYYDVDPGTFLWNTLTRKIDIFCSFESFRCQLKCPGHNKSDGKTKHDRRNNYFHHPYGCFEGWKKDRRSLNHQPRNDCVSDRNLVDIAPLQFGEEIG